MRQSATLGRFQDRAPYRESWEVIDLWSLFRRRLRLPNALCHQTKKKRQSGGILVGLQGI